LFPPAKDMDADVRRHNGGSAAGESDSTAAGMKPIKTATVSHQTDRRPARRFKSDCPTYPAA
jgi:hypothetical protein